MRGEEDRDGGWWPAEALLALLALLGCPMMPTLLTCSIALGVVLFVASWALPDTPKGGL
jgi:hypothetical protein